MQPELGVILALGAVDRLVGERLADYGELVQLDPRDRSAIDRMLPTTVAIVARASAVIDAAIVEGAPRLRVIGRSGVGVDQVDIASATRHNIPVVVTPNANSRAVAEGALALMLHLVKRLGRFTELVREGRWDARETLPLGDLDGATLGIVGLGRIGRRLAELASVLGMRVLAYDPYAEPATVDPTIALTDLGRLAAQSDVISLHAPLTPDTRGLIGADVLARVKRGAVLVNCGRGGLLDLDAAHDALQDGRLAGVGLDVFDPEPAVDHPLLHHPDVVLTPHVMGLSQRARRLVFEEMTDGMAAVLSGRQAPHVANPQVYESGA